MLTDMINIKAITGRMPVGMAYPYGSYSDETVDVLRELGIKYARGTWSSHNFDLQPDLLRFRPTCHHKDAALFMMFLYAVKTLLVFPPIMALQIAVGLYFPTWVAIIVNIVCMALEHSLGYAIGRFIGLDVTDKLLKKHPKVQEIVSSTRNRWFISYILRALNMLPMDIVSMYLGTQKFPFLVYLSGSLAGALFGIIAATVIGMSLTDPTSSTFIIACAISITLSALSCLIYYLLTKSKKNGEKK